MAHSEIVSPASITKDAFHRLLDQYPALIDSLSKSQRTKSDQKTLSELDQYRFVDAPSQFSISAPQRPMGKLDVETLVQWKLRHGKFRPTLMSLVSSNDPALTARTIASALTLYHPHHSVDGALAAVKELAKLKGIGPATASLLLAVHDPDRVIFFSDEAYQWLCGRPGGSIKYNMAEYRELVGEAERFAKGMGVGMVEIEKAAYVMMKGGGGGLMGNDGGARGAKKGGFKRKMADRDAEVDEKSTPGEEKAKGKSSKEITGNGDDGSRPVRRSKRLQR